MNDIHKNDMAQVCPCEAQKQVEYQSQSQQIAHFLQDLEMPSPSTIFKVIGEYGYVGQERARANGLKDSRGIECFKRDFNGHFVKGVLSFN